MGTPFRIVACAPDSATGAVAMAAAWARIEALERVLSDYDPDSEVSRLARVPAGRATRVSEDLAVALALSESLWRRTDGAFDAALGAMTREWRRAMRRNTPVPDAERTQAMRRSGWRLVDRSRDGRSVTFLEDGMRLDFGAIGKGLAADEALATLARHGVRAALVDAGGDVSASGAPPDRPGWLVEMPSGFRVWLREGSVATSGSTRRNVEGPEGRQGHILDPATGLGIAGSRLVSVYAATGAEADALATAASVAGPEKGAELLRREALGGLLEYETGTAPRSGASRVVVGRWPPRAGADAKPSECGATPVPQVLREP